MNISVEDLCVIYWKSRRKFFKLTRSSRRQWIEKKSLTRLAHFLTSLLACILIAMRGIRPRYIHIDDENVRNKQHTTESRTRCQPATTAACSSHCNCYHLPPPPPARQHEENQNIATAHVHMLGEEKCRAFSTTQRTPLPYRTGKTPKWKDTLRQWKYSAQLCRVDFLQLLFFLYMKQFPLIFHTILEI